MQHIMHIYFNFTFEPVEETGSTRRNIHFQSVYLARKRKSIGFRDIFFAKEEGI